MKQILFSVTPSKPHSAAIMDDMDETKETTITTVVHHQSKTTQAMRSSSTSTLVNSPLDLAPSASAIKEELFVCPAEEIVSPVVDPSPTDAPTAPTPETQEPRKRLLPRVVGSLRSYVSRIYPHGQGGQEDGNLEDLESVDIGIPCYSCAMHL
jgi:hypothetical protein